MNRKTAWYSRSASVETLQLRMRTRGVRKINPSSLAFDIDGILVVGDELGGRIFKVDIASGDCSLFAGSEKGQRNGWISQAQFSRPTDILVAPDQSVYVADPCSASFADNVRVIEGSRVRSYVGTLRRVLRDADHESVGPAENVRLHEPEGLELLPDGSLLVALAGQDRIIRVSPEKVVTNLIGHDPN